MNCRILFVIHSLGYGGSPRIMAYLANRLTLDGYEVFLLTYEDMTLMQELVPEVKQIGFSYSALPIFAVRRISQITQLRKVLKDIQPNILISFLPYPNMISIIASKGTQIPVVISQRGDPFALQSWFTKFRDFVYNFADGYVFQTNGAKNYYNKRIQARATVIPNPIVARNIPAKWIGEREDIIVHVGRFELKTKRQDILIKAYSKIVDHYPNMNLVLFGDGADEQKIKEFISNCRLEDRIVLAGVVTNVYEAIRKAKLFVLSSDNEGIPNALIEAMCVGLPCISTDCSPGGAAELIKNMENGMLVKAGSVDELANAMEYMLSNPEKAEIMGENALKIQHDLNSKVIINQWKEYIDHQILTKKSS